MKKSIFAGMGKFVLLWATQSVSSMGTEMTNYALVVWAYGQNGTASSITLLTLCSFMPTILLRFIAGAVVDHRDKKRIMLIADFLAACGTLAILLLHENESLTLRSLYVINLLLSCMNSFQVPAAYVATSLLVPKGQYGRAGGLQAVSGALISILSPALAGVLIAWGGMSSVLMIDLLTFGLAFLSLICIHIPKVDKQGEKAKKESFWENCVSGFRYLKQKPILLRLMGFIAVVNLLAKLGPDGLLSAFILSRTQGNQAVLGLVQSMVALGLLVGGMILTLKKSFVASERKIIGLCALIFLTGIGAALSRDIVGWSMMLFLQYMIAAMMNVYWNTLMRAGVPVALQGRIFSVRDTIQNCTIPLGLYLGGILADRVFQPMMDGSSPARLLFVRLVGTGDGAGLAVQFLLVALTGLVFSLVCMRSKVFHQENVNTPAK